MRHVHVKVCGLQEEAHMLAAAGAGADYVGIVFAPGRRQVRPAQAVHLVQCLDGLPVRPAVVGVFVNEAHEKVNALAEECGLDLIQLSGDEGSDYCAKVAHPIIKTISVFARTTVPEVVRKVDTIREARTGQAVSFLLYTGAATARGGTGRTFDWRVACEVAARSPGMVAGGLNCTNVGDLVLSAHPFGVDVSSGVEREGRKDSVLIHAFVRAVRKAEQEIGNGNG